jgi:hypothetical protein
LVPILLAFMAVFMFAMILVAFGVVAGLIRY